MITVCNSIFLRDFPRRIIIEDQNNEPIVLSRGDFHLPLVKDFIIQTVTASTTQKGKGFRIQIFDSKVCHRHLLWYALFQGINMIEWMILFRNLEFSIRRQRLSSLQSMIVFDILQQSSLTRKSLDHWSSQTKPIHTKLRENLVYDAKKFLNSRDQMTFLDVYMEYCNIPQKAMSKSNLYKVSEIEIPKIVLSPELYIGVGYKDKGSLSGEDRPLADELWIPDHNSVDFSSLKKDLYEILQN